MEVRSSVSVCHSEVLLAEESRDFSLVLEMTDSD